MKLIRQFVLFTSLCLCLFSCNEEIDTIVYQSEYLEIKSLSDRAFIHISYLDINSNTIPCNGVVYLNQGKAVIFDAPTNDVASAELVEWLEKTKLVVVDHVIVNHFHIDCVGGIEYFNNRGIATYGNSKTIELASDQGYNTPINSFDKILISEIGDQKIISEFIGPAHSPDNIVHYIPGSNLLFGGCMVKSMNAGKGNLDDADVTLWPETVTAIKSRFKDAEIVVPGHGEPGGLELLDYTIKLFSIENEKK